jgi:hypothetical protein
MGPELALIGHCSRQVRICGETLNRGLDPR